MSEQYCVKWEQEVAGHDPVQAAEHAADILRGGQLSLLVTNAHGASAMIEMGNDRTSPYYRVIGLDELFSPTTLIFQAEDRYAAEEMAAEYGIDKVILIEQTVLTEDAEAEVQDWIRSVANGLSGLVHLETSSAWGSYGTITLLDDIGQMQMHNYSRINDGANPGLLDAAIRRLQSLCVQRLTEVGKKVQIGEQGKDLIKVSGEGCQFYICRETGEVKGWQVSSLPAFLWATEVLIVDAIGGMEHLDDGVSIDQLRYWTKQGDCITPSKKSAHAAAPTPNFAQKLSVNS